MNFLFSLLIFFSCVYSITNLSLAEDAKSSAVGDGEAFAATDSRARVLAPALPPTRYLAYRDECSSTNQFGFLRWTTDLANFAVTGKLHVTISNAAALQPNEDSGRLDLVPCGRKKKKYRCLRVFYNGVFYYAESYGKSTWIFSPSGAGVKMKFKEMKDQTLVTSGTKYFSSTIPEACEIKPFKVILASSRSRFLKVLLVHVVIPV